KIKDYEPPFSSNFEARIDTSACTGCGKCARACPVEIIDMIEQPHDAGGKTYKKIARIEDNLCIGCGVCHAHCTFKALSMERRAKQRITPESSFRRVLLHAIDEKKLSNMIFDEADGFTMLVANRLLAAILNLPPAKQLLANEQIKSRFVERILKLKKHK
ncbi:MAG: 4Fe-4S binding protein, partial [Oligoflexales bacterium]|nr:4Fe-4S binding protein [Oligoflexales bacterium]